MIKQWSDVREFYLVVNDKYRGVDPDSEMLIEELRKTYNLDKAEILIAKDLENMVFQLDDDQIEIIIGRLPDPSYLKMLDYSVLNDVITYIMDIETDIDTEYKMIAPDFEEKITFNGLTERAARYLINGSFKLSYLDDYIRNNSTFVAEDLRDKLRTVYLNKKKYFKGDELFWKMVKELCPENKYMYQASVIVVMSKYFETCDIFEEPEDRE